MCFNLIVYRDDWEELQTCPLDILKYSTENCVCVKLPKLNAISGVYFSIYGVQKFCQKVNKQQCNRGDWGLSNVEQDDEYYTCEIRRDMSITENVPSSVVDALNEEIESNVYDETFYKTLLVKSVIYKNHVERALCT